MQNNKNILIIGGGPSGLAASAQLSKLGYLPFLIEKEDQLGGHLNTWDRLFPDRESAEDIKKELISDLGNTKWFVSTTIDYINRLENSYNIQLSNGISIIADAILVATGFDLFKAEKKEEYGYGIYEKVITNADLEKFFKTGYDKRIIKNPKSIAFVHCVGSRDEKVGNRYCSKVCCVTAIKQACELKEVFPDATIYCFYMDLRMFGKRYEELYYEAQTKYGIRFIRGRVSEIFEANAESSLIIKAEDTLTSKPLRISVDLAVLMAGMCHSEKTNDISNMLSLSIDNDGFLKSLSNTAHICESAHEGVFYAGACTGPKNIPESLSEGRSAALIIHNYLIDKNIKEEKNND